MLKFYFDPKKCYRVVIYARMSHKNQNARSPDQQIKDIKERLRRLRLNWTIVKIYRDDAKRGIYQRKRPQYSQMIDDLRSGMVVAELVLVDNIERFGRLEELPTIRKELFDHHGVLVLAADSDFCDPTTPQGKAMGFFEAFRASDANRIKAMEVVRGKKDTAELKHWPGGETPFGCRLVPITKEYDGKTKFEGSVLEPHPETGWIITLLYQRAYETGHGQTLLARYLKDHPDIPLKYKKRFTPATVGYWLRNPIYKGLLVWNRVCTGVITDQRVIQQNPDDEVKRIPEFCAPLVKPEIWDAVNQQRIARSQISRKSRASSGKLIEAAAPGLVLQYILSGLVRCGHCGAAMTPSSSATYQAKLGGERRYVSYVCPGYLARTCPNNKRVPERWLRQVVLDTIHRRVIPPTARKASKA